MLGRMRQDPLRFLWQPATMQRRAAAVLRAAQAGNSPYFRIDLPALMQWVHERLVPATDVTPGPADVPMPWAHQPPVEAARSACDFAVVASLLSAHPGANWTFDPTRQEALALPQHRQSSDDLLALLNAASASPAPAPRPDTQHAPSRWSGALGMLRATALAFESGAFSSDPQQPWRADVRALRLLDTAAVRAMFQAGPENIWVGLEGRTAMLRGWADAIALTTAAPSPEVIARASEPFFPFLSPEPGPPATQSLLDAVMRLWAMARPEVNRVLGLPAGDVWPHRWAGREVDENGQTDMGTSGVMPLHHQALVMAQALDEVIAQVRGASALPLSLPAATDAVSVQAMLDAGALQVRHLSDRRHTWRPEDEWTIEARALSMALWEQAAHQLREIAPSRMGQCVSVRTWQRSYAASIPMKVEADAVALLSGQGTYF